MKSRRIAFNLAFIESGPLTGPGYYAVETFKALHALVRQERPEIELTAFVRPEAAHHIAGPAREALVEVKVPGRGRVARVLWEQAVLPFLSRRRGVELLFSPAFVSPLWGAPNLVVCIPDMYYAVIPEMIDQRQRRYWSIFIPLSTWRCRRVLAISEQTSRDIERILPAANGKIRVTPLANRMVPSGPIRPDQPWQPYLLMVANLTANKNIEVVVEALSMLRQEGVDLRLIHVGRDDLGRLDRAMDLFGARGYVEQLGKVTDERLETLYREAFTVVNASLYEGFGLPAVEAQAMGAPLISSNHGALVEAAGNDGALFYDPRDAHALKGRIIDLWRDPALRTALRRRGLNNSARLSWPKTASLTLAAFDEALAECH